MSRSTQFPVDTIEAKIAKAGRRDLNALEQAGAPRDGLVRLLALVASDDNQWKDLMRAKQVELRNNARRMEKLAKDAERQAKDPSSLLEFWVCFCGHGSTLGMDCPAAQMESDPLVGFLTSGLRTWAKVNRRNADAFGTYLRKFARTDSGIVLLLVAVCVWTKRRKVCHFEELARLLKDAFEASGKSKTFNADGLRKTFDRIVPRVLRLVEKYRQQGHPATSPMESRSPARLRSDCVPTMRDFGHIVR